MKSYIAAVTIKTACGLPLKAGDTFTEDEVESGCLTSMLRMRQCVEVIDVPPAPLVATVPVVKPTEPPKADAPKAPEEVKAGVVPPIIGPAKPPDLRAKK